MNPDYRNKVFLCLTLSIVLTSNVAGETVNKPSTDVEHSMDKRSVSFQADNTDKRASMGFHGMRGKKDSYLLDDFDKRAPMGFHGMRGKKYDDNFDVGFHGIRGNQYDEFLDKRASMGFHGMRGKKDEEVDEMIPELDNTYLVSSGFYTDDDLTKRAMGFQGVRGKKDEEDLLNEKRAMGFQGTRGKKLSDYSFKRAMGFLGMRGKKSSDVWDTQQRFDKKAPNSAFFGMRGKKDQPTEDVDDLEDLLLYLKSPDKALDRTRRGTNWLRNTKKAKTAFFGVRGKKSGDRINFTSRK